MRIPKAVEKAILENRAYFREKDREMRKRSGGKAGFITKPDKLEGELAFWTIEDDEELDEFLFGDLLPALYGNVDLAPLPKGYASLIDVLEFERHCQFEGWTAVSNRSSEMKRIIASYRFVGLAQEAAALTAVVAAYEKIDDDDEGFHDILGKAYGSVENDTPDVEDRTPILFTFVREHPELFGEPG